MWYFLRGPRLCPHWASIPAVGTGGELKDVARSHRLGHCLILPTGSLTLAHLHVCSPDGFWALPSPGRGHLPHPRGSQPSQRASSGLWKKRSPEPAAGLSAAHHCLPHAENAVSLRFLPGERPARSELALICSCSAPAPAPTGWPGCMSCSSRGSLQLTCVWALQADQPVKRILQTDF